MAETLTGKALEEELATVPAWTQDEDSIIHTFSFSSYLGGIDFVKEVALLAEAANHHPDILIEWRKVTLVLTTHSAKGLTALDFKLAREIDALAETSV